MERKHREGFNCTNETSRRLSELAKEKDMSKSAYVCMLINDAYIKSKIKFEPRKDNGYPF